jgi:hypothetical protein
MNGMGGRWVRSAKRQPWLRRSCRAANFSVYHCARLRTHDASIGFRLFSRRVIDRISVESDRGFCYSNYAIRREACRSKAATQCGKTRDLNECQQNGRK